MYVGSVVRFVLLFPEASIKRRSRSQVLVPRVAFLENDQVTEITELKQDTFDWERQWYPLAFVSYLDPKVPHPRELLGVRLVLWRDATGAWQCFEDKCPHRMAPLSEGRIEPSDGTLMCSYHGWRFDGGGSCVDVPQSLDSKANAAACNSPRSCAIARPTKVLQGKVFVWGRSSPAAAREAAAKPVPLVHDMAASADVPMCTAEGVPTVPFRKDYYRELPFGWEVLAENLLDPSHLPFAHHGVINRRDDENVANYRMASMRDRSQPTGGIPDVIRMAGKIMRPRDGNLQATTFHFHAPTLIRWYSNTDKDDSHGMWTDMLVFYVVPLGQGRSALLQSGYTTAAAFKRTSLLAQLAFKYEPQWEAHCFSHDIFDGDSKILHMQERILAEASAKGGSSWRRTYFMPAQSDRLVAAFRKWLDERGGGGPPTRLPPGQVPPLDDREEVFLNRFSSHTRHCPSCLGAARNFKRLRIAAVATGVLCWLGLSSALGKGLSPLHPVPAATEAGMVVSLATWYMAGRYLQRFHFMGYNHSEK